MMSEMVCPKCGAKVPEGAAECPSCGVIFAKLRALAEREKREAAAAVEVADAAPVPTPVVDPWLGRKIAAGITVAWLVGFGLYYRHAVIEARKRALKTDIRARQTVLMRDPATGDLKAVDVITAPAGVRK